MATTTTIPNKTVSKNPSCAAERLQVHPANRNDGFDAVISEQSLGYNTPQIVARRLWAPLFVMALMGWGVGFVLAIIEAPNRPG